MASAHDRRDAVSAGVVSNVLLEMAGTARFTWNGSPSRGRWRFVA